jgi:hypothetical protein
MSIQGSGLPNQEKKGGLKRIFAIRLARQDTPANAPHQGSVTSNQLLKGGCIAFLGELKQQLGVRLLGKGLAELAVTGNDCGKSRCGHEPFSRDDGKSNLPYFFREVRKRPKDFEQF